MTSLLATACAEEAVAPPAVCQNSVLELGEACDDGNDDDTDECLNTCALARCGDGVVQVDVEACDDGNDIDTDACLSTCVAASCGDGVVGPGEGCDDANDNPTDDCNNCQPATCGDGAVQEGELCDDGNEVDTDPCLTTCAPATCGDGVIWDGEETCDDGNSNARDACTSSCDLAVCGDGIQRNDLTPEQDGFEECDDGNAELGDGCSDHCLREVCGNGRVDQGEACDDGNTQAADGCTDRCQIARCGDGVVRRGLQFGAEQYEECDDGNDDPADGCSASCLREVCGNAIVDPGEACDDGNRRNLDGCSNDCAIEQLDAQLSGTVFGSPAGLGAGVQVCVQNRQPDYPCVGSDGNARYTMTVPANEDIVLVINYPEPERIIPTLTRLRVPPGEVVWDSFVIDYDLFFLSGLLFGHDMDPHRAHALVNTSGFNTPGVAGALLSVTPGGRSIYVSGGVPSGGLTETASDGSALVLDTGVGDATSAGVVPPDTHTCRPHPYAVQRDDRPLLAGAAGHISMARFECSER